MVSINDPKALDDEQEARPFFNAGRLTTSASARNLLESVFAAAARRGRLRTAVTTGDNVLMTAHALRVPLVRVERRRRGDVRARARCVLAAHAESARRASVEFPRRRLLEAATPSGVERPRRGLLVEATSFRGGGVPQCPRCFIEGWA